MLSLLNKHKGFAVIFLGGLQHTPLAADDFEFCCEQLSLMLALLHLLLELLDDAQLGNLKNGVIRGFRDCFCECTSSAARRSASLCS
jgi:hypothetical protein